jgi:hypothetical protein
MSRLIYQLVKALDNEELATSRTLAKKLNLVAGPQIAFEEQELYPLVSKRTRDVTFVRSLCAEHNRTRDAVEILVSGRDINNELRQQLLRGMRNGLDHTEHCGTLISHLADLTEKEQEQALNRLTQLQTEKRRWTELSKGE